MIHALSYAKINLCLLVLGKRPDGYHEVKSVMQTISLADRMDFELMDEDKILLECDHPEFPKQEENIIYRAVELFREFTGCVRGVRVSVEKKIPIAAGLGGGSSNAATTLTALNCMCGQLLEKKALADLGSRLGSDVPFFIYGGTALSEGRGEIITQLEFPGEVQAVLINPGIPVSTASIYRKLTLGLTTTLRDLSIATAFSADSLKKRSFYHAVRNDLEPVVINEFPEVRKAREFLVDRGAAAVAVSGSGGTVFGLFESDEAATKVSEKAGKVFSWTRAVKLIDPRN
jgi:4-diphosphocytidyl-2-C-methyl-D-erythritol kinase